MILGTISHYEKPTKKTLKKQNKTKQKKHTTLSFYSSFKFIILGMTIFHWRPSQWQEASFQQSLVQIRLIKKKNNNNAMKSFDIVWVAITTQLLDPCLEKQNGEGEGKGFRP